MTMVLSTATNNKNREFAPRPSLPADRMPCPGIERQCGKYDDAGERCRLDGGAENFNTFL